MNTIKQIAFSVFRFLESSVFRKLEILLSGRGLGRIPGVNALCKLRHFFCFAIYKKLKSKGVVLIDIEGSKMHINTDDRGVAPMLLINGVLEQYETNLFKEMIKDGMVVVDVGANIGYYTLIAAKLVGQRGIVYAFEPEPNTYKRVCEKFKVIVQCKPILPI